MSNAIAPPALAGPLVVYQVGSCTFVREGNIVRITDEQSDLVLPIDALERFIELCHVSRQPDYVVVGYDNEPVAAQVPLDHLESYISSRRRPS